MTLEMIEEQRQACAEILRKLMDVPCARLFWNSDRDIVSDKVLSPISFDVISTKLSRGVYSSTQVFISNVRLLLSNFMASETGFRLAAARYLYDYFEKLISDGSPSINPCSLGLLRLEKKMGELSELVAETPRRTEKITGPKNVGAEVLRHPTDQYSIQVLKNDMKLLGSPELLFKAAVFIIDRQPECVVLDSSLHFKFGLMSTMTRKELHAYAQRLMEEAAKGQIH